MKLETVLFQHKVNRVALRALVDYALALSGEECAANLSNEIANRVMMIEAHVRPEIWCAISFKATSGDSTDPGEELMPPSV